MSETQQETPAPVEPHFRARRRARRQARRRVALAVLVAVVLVGAAALYVSRLGGRGEAAVSPSPSYTPGTSDLTLFAVNADKPFTAIVGTGGGRAPTVAAVPYNLLTTIPGAGSGTVASAMRESGSFGRTAVSNMLGVWVPHYAMIDLKQLSTMVGDRGGITVDLPKVLTFGGRHVGPGPTKLTGPQVAAFLTETEGAERNLRWESVLEALFAGPVTLGKGAESDDAAAARAKLAAARGAVVSEFPSDVGEGGYRTADPEATQQMLAGTFGIRQQIPTRVVVLNGIDRSTIARSVTAQLVPAGFRVTAYGDARGMHHGTTLIYVSDPAATADAERIRQTLGVGKVFSSKQPSGLSDITVIVGKDYLASIGK